MTAPARRPLVAGNWKMNLTRGPAADLARGVRAAVAGVEVEVVLAPPFTALDVVRTAIDGSPVALAAQDAHWEASGAFTGEVSVPMLADAGVSLVIVGHSERRALFGDTDDVVALKAQAVRDHGLVPIVCVGETEAERDEGRTLEVVERQIGIAVSGLAVATGAELVLAYEPVWAIGTGRTATPDQVDEVHSMIRARLRSLHGEPGERFRILYGGSVTPDTCSGIFALPDVDGALVGGASLVADRFAAIVRAAAPR